jgi:hypothetical protein
VSGSEEARHEAHGSLDRIIQMVRPQVQERLLGPEPSGPAAVAEVLTLLLAYALAIEQILSRAAGRSGTMPGHSVSVRGYVEQALSVEGGEFALGRLTKYVKDSILFFARTHSGVQEAIDRFAEDLAEALKPSRIEERVRPSSLLALFGLHEGAYWREFRQQYRTLDAAALKEMAVRQHEAKTAEMS